MVQPFLGAVNRAVERVSVARYMERHYRGSIEAVASFGHVYFYLEVDVDLCHDARIPSRQFLPSLLLASEQTSGQRSGVE